MSVTDLNFSWTGSSIEEEGFLSSEIASVTKAIRTKLGAELALAQRLNRLAHRQLNQLRLNDGESYRVDLYVALQFGRALSAFQGCVVLLERGMVPEARTIARSCFESVVFAVAATREESFLAYQSGYGRRQ